MADYRLFQGKTTQRVDSHTRRAADPEAWYYEPLDYEGDVLYSEGYPTADTARAAADAEFSEAE